VLSTSTVPTVPTKVVLSDHGTQFQSKQWQETLEQWDIQPTFSTVRHPQSNPTERVMREMRQLFRTYCQDAHANWATVLSMIELFNATPHISTGYSSYEILLGKNPTNRLSKLLGPLLPAATPASRPNPRGFGKVLPQEGVTPHDTTSILDVNR
jgi:transposase InsO family protein